MDYETIIYDKKDRVAKITFNRPKALNSQTRTMITEIGDALDDAERDEYVRAIIITGSVNGRVKLKSFNNAMVCFVIISQI